MSGLKYQEHDQEIPEGFQVFEDRLEVAGVGFRKEDAADFAARKEGWLELEREPGNKHDPNAIKVIGCNKGFLGTKRCFVGYLPKELSKAIVEGGYWGQIRPRLVRTCLGDQGFVGIYFQLLGPKERKRDFWETRSSRGGGYTDFDRVNDLIHEEKYDDAIQLLLTMVDATEKEAGKTRAGVAPWSYEKLAIIYRKQKQYQKEVGILERFERQPKAPGVTPQKLAERLIKARHLRDRDKT